MTNYLHRALFPVLKDSLAEGGVLIYETFMAGNERFGKPSNPRFLLRPGELLEAFKDLTVKGFEEGPVSRAKTRNDSKTLRCTGRVAVKSPVK